MAVLCVYVADLSLTVALTFLGSRLSTCNGHKCFPSAISSSPAITPATPETSATPKIAWVVGVVQAYVALLLMPGVDRGEEDH